MLQLDPLNPDTFPAGLWDAVASTAAAAATAAAAPAWRGTGERSAEERLREQMRADALQPFNSDDDVDDAAAAAAARSPKNADFDSESHLPPRMIEEAAQFLRLNVSARDFRPPAVDASFSPPAPLFLFDGHWLILPVTARGTPGLRLAVFACGISLLFLVWHAI